MGILNKDVIYINESERVDFLKNIIHVFDKNNIDYWLEFGTLLGAIRDRKLIPWDSDIDIGVFDINKVKKIKSEFQKHGLYIKEKPNNFMPTIEIYNSSFNKNSYFHADIYQFIKHNNTYEYNWLVRTNILCRIFNYMCYLFRQERVINASVFRVKLTDNIIKLTKNMPSPVNKLLHYIFLKMDVFFSHNRKLIFKNFKTKQIKLYNTMMKIPDNAEEHLLLNYGSDWKTPKKETQTGGIEFIRKVKDGIEMCCLSEDCYEQI